MRRRSSPVFGIRGTRGARSALILLLSTALMIPQAVIPSTIAAADPTPPLSTKVNFQPDTAAVPAGYVKDIGGAYSDAAGMGWIRQDSLTAAHVPLALPLNTRVRSCTALPAPQQTFIHMQAPVTNSTNNNTPGAWEYRLANGRYQVTVGVGDPNPGADAERHVVNVEGIRAIDQFPASTAVACTASRLKTATVLATVTDGLLTVDAVGGLNTKLAFVTVDSVSVSDVTATAGAGSIAVDWTDAPEATGYRIWRGVNLPVVTTGTPLATTTASEFVDTTAVKGTSYFYAVSTATSAFPDQTRVPALVDDPTPAAVTLPATIDFVEGPGAGPISTSPAGAIRDFGQNYANLRGYGWITPGTSLPASLVGNGRARVAGSADPLDSMIHMQYGTIPNVNLANGIPESGAWQLAVPAGSYDVKVAVGDVNASTDAMVHHINVEGATFLDHPVTATGARTAEATKTVQVTDGFLTVDAIGGVNTKIAYLTIAPTPTDPAPAAPTALVATAGDNSVGLDWADNTEADLAGYQVFRGTTAAVATTGTPISGATPLTASAFTDTTAVNDTTSFYVVVGVDAAGQKSTASASAAATPSATSPSLTTLPLRVDFNDNSAAANALVAAGRVGDHGLPYTNARGRGWVTPGTGTGVSLVGNGRLRADRIGVAVDPRQRGLVHMQGTDVLGTFSPGVRTVGAYEVAVPNGSYSVTVSVGDQPGSPTASCVAPCYDSRHSITVESTLAIDRFQATAATEFATRTVVVKVEDGKLTVAPTGGTNTKINFLDVEVADTTAPTVPTGVTVAAGDTVNAVSWTPVTDTGAVTYTLYAAAGDTVALTEANKKYTGLPTTFEHTGLTNGTKVSYVVTATDVAGNVSAASTVAAGTPLDRTAPAAPTGVAAVAGDARVALRWNAVAATDVTTYRVYRSTGDTVELTPANLITTVAAEVLSFTDTGLTNGTTVSYVVIAVDADGNASPASEVRPATPTLAPDLTAPAAPTGVIVTAGDNAVSLAWTPNTENDVVGYVVRRSATAGEPGAALNAIPLTTPTYTDATAVNGTTYFYVITAVDGASNESPKSDEVSATPADTVAPVIPTGVTATAGRHSVTVRWTANTETDLRGYRIHRSTSAAFTADDSNLVGILIRPGRTYVDSDLDAGTPYHYAVVAYDAVGNRSAASPIVSATPLDDPDTTAPNPVTGVTATVSDSRVNVGWSASAATDLVGYNVYRSATAAGARVKLTNVPQAATTYTDLSAPAGSASFYTVTAVDAAGNESTPSSEATATVPAADLAVKFVFQPANSPAVAGYTTETGAAYSTTRGYGWVRQDSLTNVTATPLDFTANTRLRTRAAVTELQNRAIHLQYADIVPTPTGNGSLVPGAWEYGVPNGRYTVSMSVGDQPGADKAGCAAPCYDSQHTVRVEGVTAIGRFQPATGTEYATATVTVDVTDGRLTVDAVGGTNTKMNWLTLSSSGPVVPDTTAPDAPTGVLTNAGNTGVTLTWTAPVATDVAGYNVYRSTTAPFTPGVGNRANTTGPVANPNFTDVNLTNGTRYFYLVTAVDQAGNESAGSAVANATPTDAAPAPLTVRIDYTDAATIAAGGYVRDYGQAFGARNGTNQGTGLSYGWLALATDLPTSLEGNGRNRNVVGPGNTTAANQPDPRLASFVHMQLAAATNGGSITPGKWEMTVPNGAYQVTVAVGDAGVPVDSVNWVNIENQNAIAAFVPSAAGRFGTATRTVVVADGRLTLTPTGGANTKIAYVDIDSVDLAGRPYSSAVTPANGATEVVLNASVTADNNLNGETGAVDETTLGGGTVKVTRVADGVAVPGTGATSGGGDTVSFQASTPLAANTLYRFEITAGVKDKSGRTFMPFSSVFTTKGAGTGGNTGVIPASVAFDRIDSGAAKGAMYTSIVMGPDGKLYAGSITGEIYRWTVNADGTLANRETITTVRTHASTRGWEGAPNRTIIGLTFDPASTASNLILWITDNYAYLGSDVPDVTGAISKLTGPNLENYQEVVVNLPRSLKDHETNSIAFNDGRLYITQGSMNAMGNIDGTWKRHEHLLSAAVLELDPAKLPAVLPLDVATPDVSAPARSGTAAHTGTYDPYASTAPLTIYATGVRNAFDLVWHSNGHLYAGTNGSAAGGSTPAAPAPGAFPATCANRPEGSYTGPAAPQIANNQQAETDYVFDVKRNGYYGHPNPVRCEYVLNAGNPVGYAGNPLYKVNQYPLGQPADPNYDLAGVNDAGLHASANGTIEYANTAAFGGALAGKLITVRYSANQEVVAFVPNADGSLSKAVTGITGFTGFKQPLDIAQNPENGYLYVTELTDNPATTGIQLLKPQGGSGSTPKAEPTPRVVFTEIVGGAASAAQNVLVKNVGGAPMVISAVSIGGTDAAQFVRTGGPALPAAVAPGETATFPVVFNPTVAGPRGAVITFTTDSPSTPTATTTLRGLGTLGAGGTNEPSLQWILDTLQIPVNVGDPNPANNDLPAGSALIGDEVAVTSFTKAAFDHVVEVQAISLFGPAGPTANPNVVTVGVHATADPSQRTTLLRGPNTSNQLVLPAMTPVGEYDLETPFGFDFTWHGLSDRVAWSEDVRNTWDPTNTHKVRVYQLRNAAGVVEPNAYIVAPEDVLSPVDFQDAVVIVRNVKPAPVAGAGSITVTPTELVFSGVRGATTATRTLTVGNSSTTPLRISDVRVAGTHGDSFVITGGPQTLAAGATATYTVRFAPGTNSTIGYQSATLTFNSDDAAKPTLSVGLFGLATTGEQGNNEPPLKAVVDTLGRTIDVGGAGLILGINPAPIGDEVSAPLFTRVGTGPVGITPVARYSPDELLPFGWYTAATGEAVTNVVATIALDNEQTLNPAIVPGGASSFDPGTESFGIFVDSKSFGRKSYTQDGLNTNIPHAARTYPAKDRAGNLIPNTYLVTFEDAQNGDYQDYVFELTNVKPASATGPTTPVARIDFQPATATVAAGYTADTGVAYSAATGSGWVVPGSSTPIDMTGQTRDRAGTIDAKLRTLILMQPTLGQSPNGPGAWEYTVPNGTYVVTVGAGDPGFTDSVNKVQVEGVTAVSFTPAGTDMYRTGTVTVNVTDGRLTLDAIGGTNTKLQFVDIDRPSAIGDTTAPTVSASLSGLQASAGVYKNSVDISVVATDTGSGVAGRAYSLDGAAFVAYTAPVTVATVGAHTLRVRAVDVAGNIATSATVNFSIVTAAASRAEISLVNADGVPFADRLVMNRIQTPETGRRCRDTAACDPVTGPFFPVNVTHDVATLSIRNTGAEPLNVTGLTVDGPFALVNATALPALVPVNGALSVPVRFNATTIGTSGGLWTGTLTVLSDDVDEPSLPVELAGFWQALSENNQEPNVAEIARLFGYGTQITANGVPLNENGLVHASGDEVLSPYWLRADTTQPVTVRQLAAYHTQGNTAQFRFHLKGSTGFTNAVTHAGVEGQSILPHQNGSTTVYAAGTYAPTAAFGFNIDGEWSDPTRNNQTADVTNGCAGPCGHHVRIWAARDRAGAIIANTWLVGMDYSGINYDYNDNVYLLTNMKPETAMNPGAPAPLPGAAQLQLGFDAAYPGTLTDKDGETTGFVSTQPNRFDLSPGSISYNRALLDLVTGGSGTLAVTSSGTASAGTNGAADNTLVNGLRVPFDATGGTFTVNSRMLGPVTLFDTGSEQQAIQFGPDQDNFVKVAVINRAGVPGVEFYAEQAGVGATVGTSVNLPSPASVTSVELGLVGTPSARTVKAVYRVNGGGWIALPTVLTLPVTTAGKFFGIQAQAGILVSHKGGTQFVSTFDQFRVDDGDITVAAPVQEALYRLDVAGAGNYTDSKGNVWTPDAGRFTPTTAISEGATTTPLEIAGTVDDVLFRTYRGNVGNVAQAQRVLNYALPTKGATTVDVRLYFAERAAANTTAGKRVFDITVEGRTVRSGFDIVAAAGGQNTATVLPINDVTVSGGLLELGFAASVDYPSIAAIEVLCKGTCPVDTTAPGAPTGLTATAAATGVTLDWADNVEPDLTGYDVYRAASATGTFTKVNATPVTVSTYVDTTTAANSTFAYQVRAVDSSENASAVSATVTVTTPAPPTQAAVYVNTGGPTQTVGGITWTGCASLTTCNNWVSGGNAYAEADTVTGIPVGLNNTMFQSEWTGTAATGARAFGYQIPVLNGSYQVRLYYAELNKTAANARTFDVRLEGATVAADFDVFAQAGGIDRAIVRSYTTTVTDGNVTIDFIRRIENAKISAIAIVPVDTTAPSTVTGVAAAGTANGVDLSWAASPATDLAGYNVYRSTSATGTYTKVNTTLLTGLTYADTTAPATAAFYQVTAVDQSGNESVRSATATATRTDVTAPAVVTGVTAAGTATAITIGWSASTATDLAGYHVYRSTSATGTFTRVNAALVTGATTYTDATAPLGTSFYQVTAVDQAGNESVRSATVSSVRGDTTPPAAVTGLTATGVASGIDLAWTASAATDLAGYQLYRSTSATGTYTRVNTALLTTTTYADTTAPDGAAAFYQLTAVDQAGNESVRSATASATRLDTTAPVQVTGVTATSATTGITLGWVASAATDLAGYQVYRSTATTGTYTRVNAALVTGAGYVDAAAPAGAASFYQVTAVDRSGNESVRSATAGATRPAAPAASTVRINTGGPAQTINGVTWSACASLTACNGWVSGGNAYAEADVISGIPAGLNNTMFQSEWTWSAATGARAFGFQVPVANGAYTVRLYYAELNKAAAGARTFDVRLENTTVAANFDVFAQSGGIDRAIVRSYTATVTDGAVTLDFIRRIENAKISAIEIVPLDTTAPGAVTGVTATAAASGITLGWSASAATDLAGYQVYRSTSATGTYARANGTVLTGTTYADTAAPAGVASFYQVTAVDRSGNESVRSATVSATRPAATRNPIRINAGGPAVTTGGVAWSADQFFSGGKTYTNAQVTAIAGTTDDVLYRTERSAASFAYAVPVANGVYDVRLTFAELYHGATGGGPGGAGRRVFSANIEGGAVELANFDINAAVAPMTAVSRTYRMTITDGVANIAFTSTVDQAKVSGIEILPVG